VKRIRAFEFNDSRWCPAVIRESITEILGNTFRRGKVYLGLSEEFREFCRGLNGGVILDLCSGSGMPAVAMLDSLGESGPKPARMILSDLFPNVESLRQSERQHPDLLESRLQPVDATRLPADIDYDAITMFSALHHFDLAEIQLIIDGCVKNGKGLFFVEAFPRHIRCFLPIFLYALVPLLLNPFTTPKNKFSKFVLTYLIPVIPNAMLWDGIVSVLRIHTPEDLMALVGKHHRSYQFSFKEVPIAFGGRVTVFMGMPKIWVRQSEMGAFPEK
jgi:ubiquinone/menaquinone biosynthesis C-methylase UbiE